MEFISAFGANLGSALTIALAFLFALTVVVFVHEYGHFQVARWCGVAVKTFSIGFGKELYGWSDRHGTRWRIAAIPLGGYVQFVDDANPASAGASEDAPKEELTEEQRAGAFHTKPVWKRAAVVAAGPAFNFLFAILIFAAMFLTLGRTVMEAKVAQVTPNSPAAEAGFKRGDVIVSIDGNKIEGFSELQNIVATRVGQELAFGVIRDGANLTLTAVPELREVDDPIVGKAKRPVIGIKGSPAPVLAAVVPESPAATAGFKAGDEIISVDGTPVEYFIEVVDIVEKQGARELAVGVRRDDAQLTLNVTPEMNDVKDAAGKTTQKPRVGFIPKRGVHTRAGPLEAIGLAADRTWVITTTTLSYLADVFTGRQGTEQIGGIIRIADAAGKVASIDWRMLIGFTAFISVSIGLINLFPIPVLDGGHLVFYAIEAIRGRPLSEEIQEYSFRIGLALILMLLIFTLYNDRGILARWLSLTS